jgi:tripartite-type tricarboxylate transporter receptor subunit TctC
MREGCLGLRSKRDAPGWAGLERKYNPSDRRNGRATRGSRTRPCFKMRPEEAAMNGRRELGCGTLGLGLGAVLPRSAGAEHWPDRPIRWVVGYGAGGTSDVLARLIGGTMGERLGQPVVVENRPGAGAIVATEAVVRAPADGHTLLTVDNGILVYNPALYRHLPFDPDADLVPVTLLARATFFLVVRRDGLLMSFADVQAAARRASLTFGTQAVASPHHLAMEVLKRHADLRAEHVPYRGAPAVAQDLLAGRIDLVPFDATNALPLLRGGDARALLTFGEARSALQPEVPTARELGFRDAVAAGWLGLGVAKGTPGPIIGKLHETTRRPVLGDSVSTRLRDQGLEVAASGPREFEALVRAEAATWRPLIRDLGLRIAD